MNIPPMVLNMLTTQMKDNPMAQQFVQILQSGDNKAGEEMAMNICQSYGVSKEEALQKAHEWAKNAFPGMNL